MRDLGRASVQIVHDLKNQINGLKLYATFLRKRLDKAGRPADELETVAKLLAGLERAATDMNLLVRYGRPLTLRPAPRGNLAKMLSAAIGDEVKIKVGGHTFTGDFDTAALTEALRDITDGALHSRVHAGDAKGLLEIGLSRDESGGAPHAVIEWAGVKHAAAEDLFHSFAGSHGMRMALAAKIIRAHDGDATHEADKLRVRLPLSKDEE